LSKSKTQVHYEENSNMKAKSFKVFLIVAMLVIAIVPSASAGGGGPVVPLTAPPSAENGEMTNETPHQWFVKLSGAPVADGNTALAVKTEHQNFRDAAKKENIEYKEQYSYDTLWNGFSVSAKTAELGKLSRIKGVIAIYPVTIVSIPETTTSTLDPELYTALAMTGADRAQSELGYTGMGIRVAVMDTGIDYDHQAFGGDGVTRSDSNVFPTSRVTKGWDFVGDAYNADDTSPAYNPIPTPDAYPDDCNGHGTHVAGIIGANDPTNDLKGVAPDVTFGAYRVFGCEGSTTDAIMLAAMERAYKDRMQVLNMSIGSAFEWPQSPTGEAASRLVTKGMVVVASIGNNGANGLYSAGAPGLGEKVIGVASFDNTNVFLPYFTVNGTNIGYITMTFSEPAPLSGGSEIVYVGRGCADGDLVTPGLQPDPYLADPAGKTALIVRGVCSFGEKAARAITAGATAVVIQNNTTGVLSGTLGTPLGSLVPVVGISHADGDFIIAQTAPITMTWTDQQASFPSPTGGLISSFSSYGLSPDLALKPDIGAPGGNIYSTFPLEQGGYATLSGTSMSSPHVAGTAALLLQAKPITKAENVGAILQNSAAPALWWGNPGLGYLDNVHRQGAGMVQIDDAITATTTIQPGKLSLGESQSGPAARWLTIKSTSRTAVIYDLSFENALSTSGVITPGFWYSDANVTFNKPSVTVKLGIAGQVKATITPATYPTNGQYGGYIIFTPRGGGQVFRVPFAGFVGDYQSIEVLTHPFGLPLMYDQFGDDTVTTFSMVGSDLPYFGAHFEHQSRLLRLEAFDAITGKSVGIVYQLDYWIRNSTSTGYYEFAWDGTTLKSNKVYIVPNGQYIVKLAVLKALGNAKNPADWETWSSPVLTIARP
jgi:minor extracellular serine protease Vpr